MIEKIKENAGKLHIAAYSALIIAGVGGYTDLLLELGELRSDVKHYEQTINSLVDENADLEEKCDA